MSRNDKSDEKNEATYGHLYMLDTKIIHSKNVNKPHNYCRRIPTLSPENHKSWGKHHRFRYTVEPPWPLTANC